MDDRRSGRRFSMSLPVEVHAGAAREASAVATQTRDVSYRGLYFTVDRELEVGSRIEFVLTLPREITLTTEVRVQCAGRVVRVDRPSAGAQVGVAAVIEQYNFLSPAT